MAPEVAARSAELATRARPSPTPRPPATLPTDAIPETPGERSSSGVSDYVVSHLRTLVPIVWGAAVIYVADHYVAGIPRAVATDPTAISVATSVATFAWYALWRVLEPRLPAFVTVLLLGSPRPPEYPA